jgi:glucuronyl/N-acetylglucosaminyl transferase EXT2
VIDWKRFSLRIHESDLPKVFDILYDVSQKRKVELRQQGDVIYRKYFSTLAAMTKTTLDILNDRIFSHHAKNYLDWNVFPNTRSPLFLQQTAPASAGFTAVILTYDRLDSLFAVINRVAEVPSLTQILVVWNNQVTML